jgi:4-alpha-glucanotransferase
MAILDRRMSGVLLHPTSLPGPHGSGDFGPAAFHFIDWLAVAGQDVWQILPLNPAGPGNSPYSGVSAFAGSPALVALEPLIERGWLQDPVPSGPSTRHVDFGRTTELRMKSLRSAFAGFQARAQPPERSDFDAWRATQQSWLADYALFMAIDEGVRAGGGFRPWPDWEPGLARRDPAAMARASQRYREQIRFWEFVQWCFDRQWQVVRRHAAAKGVRIIGDLPIYVAHHSADCWARPDLFQLDSAGNPTAVAGVPPDFFSPTGQRWGGTLYDWPANARDGYRWWIARVRRQLDLADLVRIDHFRGFASFWQIPATSPTAIEGSWKPGPGAALFDAILGALGRLPMIAEDLGVITDDVVELRDRFELPGMRILQFGFGADAAHEFLPHNYLPNACAYTGTHDNDTVVGWWQSATPRERAFASAYLGLDDRGSDVHWKMIRAVSASVARLAVFQMQDVLGMDGTHRMNTPSQSSCWTWRFDWSDVGPQHARELAAISAAYGRAPIERLSLPAYPDGRPLP